MLENPASAAAPGPAPGAPVGSAVASEGNQFKRGELLDSIRKRQLVVVTGTGVSLHTIGHPGPGTDVASWPGLLKNGLEQCLTKKLITEGAVGVVKAQIAEGSAGSLIEAAQKIHDCMDQRDDTRRFWLRESVGQLKVKNPDLITAIANLGGLLATLNYDQLNEDVTGLPSLHWKQQADITRKIRNRQKDYVLHIHGRWDELLSQARVRGHAIIFSSSNPRLDIPEVIGLHEPSEYDVRELLQKHNFMPPGAERLAKRSNGNIYLLTRLLTGTSDRPVWLTDKDGYYGCVDRIPVLAPARPVLRCQPAVPRTEARERAGILPRSTEDVLPLRERTGDETRAG